MSRPARRDATRGFDDARPEIREPMLERLQPRFRRFPDSPPDSEKNLNLNNNRQLIIKNECQIWTLNPLELVGIGLSANPRSFTNVFISARYLFSRNCLSLNHEIKFLMRRRTFWLHEDVRSYCPCETKKETLSGNIPLSVTLKF